MVQELLWNFFVGRLAAAPVYFYVKLWITGKVLAKIL